MKQISPEREKALKDAADCSCVNHIELCNCNVCAFKKRILNLIPKLNNEKSS